MILTVYFSIAPYSHDFQHTGKATANAVASRATAKVKMPSIDMVACSMRVGLNLGMSSEGWELSRLLLGDWSLSDGVLEPGLSTTPTVSWCFRDIVVFMTGTDSRVAVKVSRE